MNNKVLYFGNFNFKTGFSSINRALGISKLFFDSFQMTTTIFCKAYDGSLEKKEFLVTNKIQIKSNDSKTKLSAKWYKNTILKEREVKIVVLYDFPYAMQCQIYKVCHARGISVISDITEWYDAKSTPLLFKIPKKIDVYLRMNFVHRHCDGLITVSDYLYNHFLRKTGDKPLIKIYPTADFFLEEKASMHVTKKPHEDSVIFCYCGNPGKGKDSLNKLIKMFDRTKLQNVTFLIAGCMPAKYLNLHSSGKVKICGNLNREQLAELYESVDYQFIIRESTRANNAGFPTKFVESLCFDVAPIFTPVSDLPSFSTSGIMVKKCTEVDEELIALLSVEKSSQRSFQDVIEKNFMTKDFLHQFKKIIGGIINEKSN